MNGVTGADGPIPGLQAGETPTAASPASRFVRSITPDLRQNPRAALRDMRLTDAALRSSLAASAAKDGITLEDGSAADDYADSDGNVISRQFTVLRSATDEVVLLEIPDWIAKDGANVGALTEVRDALTNRKVRIVTPGIDVPDFSLKRTMPMVWRKKANIDLEFVEWSYVEQVKQGKRSVSAVFAVTTGPAPPSAAGAATTAIRTVFISSTGKDLAEYREAARDICLRLNLFPVMMEYFEAMGLGATAGSKKKLDRANIYVGVFAHRYGFIEPGYEKSVTELEFDHAGELRLDRLCFVVDPNHPWPPAANDPQHFQEMTAFKARVSSLIRGEFTTVDDFKAKLQQALLPYRAQDP
jgi:hypothetical protein